MAASPQHLSDLEPNDCAEIEHVGGERSFRRRLMELGLVPGTLVQLKAIAPLGDPLELLVRGSSLSIRRADAALVAVTPVAHVATAKAGARAPGSLPPTAVRGAE
jgi:ferrous iron transport protein A